MVAGFYYIICSPHITSDILLPPLPYFVSEIISDKQVIHELEKYERLLLEERSYWIEVRQELEEVHLDIGLIKDDVQKLHKGQPQLIAEMENIQSKLKGDCERIHDA